MATTDTPMYEHDCDACVFLGRADGRELNGGREVVDLYYCPQLGGSYVMRCSDDGPDYQSGPLAAPYGWGPNDEVYRRALERAIINPMEDDGIGLLKPGDPIDFSKPFRLVIGG